MEGWEDVEELGWWKRVGGWCWHDVEREVRDGVDNPAFGDFALVMVMDVDCVEMVGWVLYQKSGSQKGYGSSRFGPNRY